MLSSPNKTLFWDADSALALPLGRYDPSTGVGGVGDCTRLVPTLSDPGETSRPRIDSIPPLRLTASAPRIKKLFSLPPINRPIELFGPLSNRTILKRLHVVFHARVKIAITGFPHGGGKTPCCSALLRRTQERDTRYPIPHNTFTRSTSLHSESDQEPAPQLCSTAGHFARYTRERCCCCKSIHCAHTPETGATNNAAN